MVYRTPALTSCSLAFETLIALAHLGGGNLGGDARPHGLILDMPDPTVSYPRSSFLEASMKQLERLLFLQGNVCFFCQQPLPAGEASVEHLVAASRALAELKGMAERMPNQAMLIDSLVLQEARASSEIENILTTNDELFKAASDEALPASAEAKEVLRYRQALHHGFRQIKERPLATGLFI